MSTGFIKFASGPDEPFTIDANHPHLQTEASAELHCLPGGTRAIVEVAYNAANLNDALVWIVLPGGNDQIVDSTGINSPGSVQSVVMGGKSGRRHRHPPKAAVNWSDDLYVLTEPPAVSEEREGTGYVPNTEPQSDNEPVNLEHGVTRIAMRVTIVHP